jgi:phosphatidylglycerol:prolipoprotein diacylglycerol transferase
VVGAAFLTGYGVLRIIGEQYREPESLYGAMPLGLSAGQLLSLPMVVLGVYYLWRPPGRSTGRP